MVTIPGTIAIDDSKSLSPSEPNIQGEPLTLDGYPNSDSTDEINCDEAETLVDEGLYEASDIADYCDYGPQNGEIDDSFEWEDDAGNP